MSDPVTSVAIDQLCIKHDIPRPFISLVEDDAENKRIKATITWSGDVTEDADELWAYGVDAGFWKNDNDSETQEIKAKFDGQSTRIIIDAPR